MTDEPDEQTLERTVEQTQPMPAAEATLESERRRIWRFLPLLILLLGIAAAAIALWILVR
jgi:type VI protein secretion system component VasF